MKPSWSWLLSVALAAGCGGTERSETRAPSVHVAPEPRAAPPSASEVEGNPAPDTVDERAVIDFCERYRLALEARDAKALLSLASPRYLDDSGTPDPNDDVSYELLEKYMDGMFTGIQRVVYEIRYREVRLEGDRIIVDVTYSATFTMAGQDRSSAADNELVLERHEGSFRFLSGM